MFEHAVRKLSKEAAAFPFVLKHIHGRGAGHKALNGCACSGKAGAAESTANEMLLDCQGVAATRYLSLSAEYSSGWSCRDQCHGPRKGPLLAPALGRSTAALY